MDSVTAAILVIQNNETAAMLVYQDNPVGIDLFSLYVLFSQYRSRDNTLGEPFLSNFVLFTCITLRIIYEKTMGRVPLGPAIGKTQHTRRGLLNSCLM